MWFFLESPPLPWKWKYTNKILKIVAFNRWAEIFTADRPKFNIQTSQTHATLPKWKQKCWTLNGRQILNIHFIYIYMPVCWAQKKELTSSTELNFILTESNFMLLCDADSLKLLFLKENFVPHAFLQKYDPSFKRASKMKVLFGVIWKPFKSKSYTRFRDFIPSYEMWLLLKMFEGLSIFGNWNSFYYHIVITRVLYQVSKSYCLLTTQKCVYIRKTNKSSEIEVAKSVQIIVCENRQVELKSKKENK